ncbi:hypothetical protein BpHYR1_045924 [Brachionus plicatilis]|uniref:Uncharacterized protein n=1 Tax=Brachionus plicatilis TaxID=10195 RepID=A0A3M7PIM2_BRAPC|nr:hypothetical protein BpHYR1_045924 [Brachionus plicatilis]
MSRFYHYQWELVCTNRSGTRTESLSVLNYLEAGKFMLGFLMRRNNTPLSLKIRIELIQNHVDFLHNIYYPNQALAFFLNKKLFY